jgi:hypothetical protein
MEYSDTLDALDLMKDITRIVNDTKKNLENARSLEEIREHIEGLEQAERELGMKNRLLINSQGKWHSKQEY